MSYPLGIESKIITGQYADLYYDRTDGQYKSRPTTGFVYVYPAVTEIRVGDTVVDLNEVNPQRIAIDEFGQFEFEAIVTDQDGIVPNNGWTYRFVPSWNEKTVNIPILETSPSTIDITDYFDAEFIPGVIITKGDPGRGIDHITSAGNIATVHFDDGTTDTFELPIGDGSGGDTPDATTSIKGKVKLAGDFAGTADVPLIGADRIDSSKLAPAVRTSLGKADTAVQPAGLTKAAVGLGNVDNTSDVNKPVSNATQSALNLKVNITSLHAVATTGSYNDLTAKPTIPDSKDDIGLGNVDNTSDANKPISTATQAALDLKSNVGHTHSQYVTSVNGETPDINGAVEVVTDWADITSKPSTFTPSAHTHAIADVTGLQGELDLKATLESPAFTGTVTGITKGMVGLGSVDNTSDANKPISTATQTALDGKANTSHTHLWADITDKPTTFAPSAHTHAIADVTNLQTSLDAKASLTGTETLTNKTVNDNTFFIQDETDNTKKVQFQVSGVTTGTTRTITIPNFTGTMYVTGGTDVSVADGGTGRSTSTTAYGIIAAGTTATGAHQTIAPGTSGHFLKSAGASALGSFAAIVATDVSDSTATGRSVLTATDAAAARTAIGAGTSNLALGTTSTTAKAGDYVPAWTEITGKPSTFTPSAHTHDVADINATGTPSATTYLRGDGTWSTPAGGGAVDSVNSQTGAVVLDTDDISDSGATNKYVTAAEKTKLSNLSGTNTGDQTITLTGEVTGSGTGSFATTVTNSAVIGKVITGYTSGAGTVAATDTILQAIQKLNGNDALKAPLASPTFTGTVSGITKAMVGLGNVDNTSDANKPVSTATQSALDGKQPLDSDLTAIAAIAPSNDDFIQRKSGAWTNRTVAQVKTDLGLTGTNSGDQTITLTGEVTGSGTGSFAATVTNSAVIGKVLTGYTSGAGTVAATDTILQAIQKLNGNIALKADSTHTHGISDVTSLQTTLDTKATKANGILGTGLPWSKELMVNGSAALAAGFNDVPGGVMADREIVLESMVFRIADPTATIGGSGNLTITWSYGSMTTTTPTTITTTNIAAGQHDIWVVLETPLTIAINNCLRASFTMGTATVSTPCHIEWRGRYA